MGVNKHLLKQGFTLLRKAIGIFEQAFTDVEPDEEQEEVVEENKDETPWLTVGLEYEGLDEEHDREELEEFLGVNPDSQAGGIAWCGAYVAACLKAVGLRLPDAPFRARSWVNYGKKLEKPKIGCLAVFNGHVAFVIAIEPEVELLGGNQSNKCKRSKARFYEDFICYVDVSMDMAA